MVSKDLHNKFEGLVAKMQTEQSKRGFDALSKATPQELGEAWRRGVTPRTSITSPLKIDAVAVEGTAGLIGMTICPGKNGPSENGGPWRRDMSTDINVLRDWQCRDLLTLMEPGELEWFHVTNIGDAAAASGIAWHFIPMTDGDPPDERFDSLWPAIGQRLVTTVRKGGRVVVHCRGGLGRTGTIVCMLLVEMGYAPKRAMELVRSVRQGTVETPAQERFVLSYSPHLETQIL